MKPTPTTKNSTRLLRQAAKNALTSLAIFAATGFAAALPYLVTDIADNAQNAILGSIMIGIMGFAFGCAAAHRALDCLAMAMQERGTERRIETRWTEQRL
jgi:hypothetical protein